MHMDDIIGYQKLKRGRGKGSPLYQQIRHQLVHQIRSGRVSLGDRLPPVSQMVKKWKVDYQTINLALERMEKDGLIRCESGRGKGSVVISEYVSTFSMMFLRGWRWSSNDGLPLEITEGVRKFAEEKNIKFSITDVSHSKDDFINTIANPLRGIDGIIVIPPPDDPEFIKACLDAHEHGVKIVFVDLNISDLPVSSVSIDHVGGAHQATRHLLGLHGEPVYCLGVTPLCSIQARLQGWGSAMCEYDYYDHGLYIYKTPYVDTTLANSTEIEIENNYQAALEILEKQKGRKTSIFACCGFAAQGTYKAAEKLGLEVGKDIYIAGFGDSATCRQLPVPLSFVSQQWEELGYEAANVLFLEMAGAMQHPMYRLLPAKFNIRASSSKPVAKDDDLSQSKWSA